MENTRKMLLELVREWIHLDSRSLLAMTPGKVALVNALYALLDDAHTDEHGQREALSILRGDK